MESVKPTVSVIMATYNGEKYLREQLDSILQQTYPVSEIIIQDDCSTDATMDIVSEYANRTPIFRCFSNERNIGYNANFKKAAMHATSDFIAISDQDDVWFPQKIEKLVEAIGNHDLCFSAHVRGVDQVNVNKVVYKYKFVSNLFTPVVGHSMLLRRDFIQHETYWEGSYFYDWNLLLNAHLHNGVVRVDDILNWHRMHSCSITHNNHTNLRDGKGKFAALLPYIKGYREFRKIQQKQPFQRIYRYLYDETKAEKFGLEHRICGLLLASGIGSFIKLCYTCMIHRDDIYPTQQTKGIKGMIRGFFFPAIFAYHTDLFDDKIFK